VRSEGCIAKGAQRYEFPDKQKVVSSYVHDLKDLVKVAGLERARIEHAKQDQDFRKRWDVVQAWSEQSRYQRHRPEAAKTLLEAVGDRRHGVISWIKPQW
jgi:hypothetical protein